MGVAVGVWVVGYGGRCGGGSRASGHSPSGVQAHWAGERAPRKDGGGVRSSLLLDVLAQKVCIPDILF